MMLQIRPVGVAHFHPECLVHFTPVGVAHIVPESLVHYSPVEVVHFTPVCSGITFQINIFMFDVAPEPLDKNIIQCPATPIHTNLNVFLYQSAQQ
jgi:hypothetical protein